MPAAKASTAAASVALVASTSSPAVSKKTPKKDKDRAKDKTTAPSSSSGKGTAYSKSIELPSTSIAQGSATSLPVLFTKDADYFCVASSSSVKIHSRTTGEVVSTLSAPDSSLTASEARNRAHVAPITGLILHPHNPLQLITTSLDGTIKIWDYLDAVLLKSIDVGYPITHLAAHTAIKTSLFVAVRKPKANAAGQKPDPFTHFGKANSIIYSVSFAVMGTKSTTTGVTSRKPRDLLRLGKTRDAAGLQVSPDGKWLLAIGNRKVQIAQISSLRDGFTKFVSDERLVSLAIHPTEPTFATGDATGKIRIWHCLDPAYIAQSKEAGGEKRAPNTLLHWHSHAVSSLAFTPNGAYLLSGGEEAVLILWQLSSRAKEFVPRLGAPISSIAVADGMDGREQEFVLGLADGTISFIGALNLKPTRTFARVKIDPSRQLQPPSRLASLPAPLAVEPVTGNVVLTASHPSSLQFFDMLNDRIVAELEVAPSNRTSRPDDAPLEPNRIEKVAFSSQRAAGHSSGPAEWMATIDSRHGGSLSSELALKFWRYSSSEGRYILNTRIDKPHEQGVTSIAFSPLSDSDDSNDLLFVSTGLDKKIKTWRIGSHTARGGRLEMYWVARSVFGYREAVPMQAAWSPDGSLLAVSQGAFVTLWEPVSNSLVTALSCPELKTPTLLSFAGRGARYVVVGGAKTVVCWDLVTNAIKWHKVYEEVVEKVLALSDRNTLAILRKAQPSGPRTGYRTKPITVIDEVDPATAGVVKSYKVAYGVREAVAANSAVAPRRAAAQDTTSAPRLVVVADNFDTFEVGQSAADSAAVNAAAGEASTSRAGEAAQSLRALGIKRRTLFDDLFGSISDVQGGGASEDQQRAAALSATRKPNKDLFSIFDAPAHLLPPVHSLFDDVMRSLLPRAKPQDEQEQERQVEEVEDADVEMQDDDDERVNEATLVRRNAANRAQEDEKTMEFLGDLFSKQILQRKSGGAAVATPAKKKASAEVNGTPTSNGVGSAGGKKKGGAVVGAGSPASKGTPNKGGNTSAKSSPAARAGMKRSSMS